MKKSGFTVFITVVSALAAVAAAVVAATLFFEKKKEGRRGTGALPRLLHSVNAWVPAIM